MVAQVFGAIDIGASGGRVVAGILDAESIRLDVVHRFSNGPVQRDGALRWDISRLYTEVLDGLAALARSYPDVVSIGIDTWAVDYGLIDRHGELLHQPYSYRDGRTNANVIDQVHDRLSPAQLYAITGLQFLPFNTIYQFAAEDRAVWDRVETALLLPDLLAFWLTGVAQAEITNASTTGLFDAASRSWSPEVFAALQLPASIMAPLRPAGSRVGTVTPQVCGRTGLSPQVVVTSVGSHDTASAVVGVPASRPEYAYISSGTWSLVGVELEAPILTESSRLANFTNEAGVDGRIRYLRNTGGLWLLQESLRHWQTQGRAIDLAELLGRAAARAPGGPRVDPSAEEFIAPGQMPQRIAQAVRRSGADLDQDDPVAVARCVIDSLADGYATTVRQAIELSGRSVQVVQVVGGGSQNEPLCQATADACGLPVIAGPVEATALGNVLVQARAHGAAPETLEDLRRLVASNSDLRHYQPQRA